MGWYITCKFCNASEKYRHPNCGCIKKQQKILLKKIVGATVVENYSYSMNVLIEFILTKYYKFIDGAPVIFYVRVCTRNSDGEYKIHDTFCEITEKSFEDCKVGDASSDDENIIEDIPLITSQVCSKISLKDLTGGDAFCTRSVSNNDEPIMFKPILICNNPPQLPVDKGTWERLENNRKNRSFYF